MGMLREKKPHPTHNRKKRGNYRDPVQGFFNFIDMDAGDCWLWLGALDKDGYGSYTPYRRRLRAHRFAYEVFVDDIPTGLSLDHLCRVRACVNPSHLEPVSNRTNILRGIAPPAINALKTHCKWGHELAGDNLRIQVKTGKRYCIECDRRRGREYERRKAAKTKNA